MNRIATITLSLLLLCSVVQAETIYSNGTGDWNDHETWQGGVIPADSDTVVLLDAVTVPGPRRPIWLSILSVFGEGCRALWFLAFVLILSLMIQHRTVQIAAVVLLLLCSAGQAWADAYTTTATGTNWSDQTHWALVPSDGTDGNDGVPGDGDTATVAHATTVDANTTVGTSPIDVPLPATARSLTSGSAVTELPTGTYVAAYTFVDGATETPRSVGTSSLAIVNASSKPRVTLPALPTGVDSINLYLTPAGGAVSTATLYCTGITGTTVDLINDDWENAYGGDGNDAVGGSTAQASAAAPPALPTAAITLSTTSGVLTVADNVTLTVRGDILKSANTARVVLAAGGHLTFDASACSTPAIGYYVLAPTAHSLTGVILDAQGTTGKHCTVSSVITGSAARGAIHSGIQSSGYLQGAQLTATYTDFSNLGGVDYNSFHMYTSSSGNTASMTDCTVNGCGQVQFAGIVSGTSVTVERTVWSNSLGSLCVQTSGGEISAGVRVMHECVFDHTVAFYSGTGWTIEDNYFGDGISATATVYGVPFKNNLVRCDTTSSTYGAWDNCYIVNQSPSNPHVLSPTTNSTSFTLSNLIIECPESDGAGDMIMHASNNTAGVLTVQDSILLPTLDGEAPGGFVSYLGSVNCRIKVNHNTIVTTGTGETGVNFGETYAGTAGMIVELQSNIFWTPVGQTAGVKVARKNAGSAVQDVVDPDYFDYNWGWNLAVGNHGRGCHSWSFVNDMWNVGDPSDPATNNAADAGIDDHGGNGSPGFFDATRNIATWAQTFHATDGTVDAALAIIAADPAEIAKESTGLIDWVRDGFRPTSYLLHNAGHDSADIGAMDYLETGTYTLAAPATATGKTGVASGNFTIALAANQYPGSIVVTPAAAGVAGTFTPATVTLTDADRTKTVTFTPTSPNIGTATITTTDNGSMGDPAGVEYEVTAAGGGGGKIIGGGIIEWKPGQQWPMAMR